VENEIVVARDGAEALDYLLCQGAYAQRSADDVPQVVLLDLRLPKVDGLQVLRRVREEPHLRALPVVVLTSSDEERDLLDSYQFGANSYVRKPVAFNEFVAAVSQLGLYWMLINRLPASTGAKS
jgi:two-component system response regulator